MSPLLWLRGSSSCRFVSALLPGRSLSLVSDSVEHIDREQRAMILGMSPLLFVHVLISLIGIATGLAVAYWLVTGKPHAGWTATFLITTILTSLTGFPLPATQLLPSHVLGIISI